jgi:hypothetical protein
MRVCLEFLIWLVGLIGSIFLFFDCKIFKRHLQKGNASRVIFGLRHMYTTSDSPKAPDRRQIK